MSHSTTESLGRAPWNPTAIAWIAFLLTPFPAFVMHTLNFRRLGLAERVRVEALKNGIAAAILAALLFAPSVHNLWLFLVTLSLASYFRATQLPYYKGHVRGGGATARLRGPILYSLAWVALLLAVVITVDAQVQQWRYDRFQSLFDRGDLDRAAQLMERQLDALPEDASPHWNLALVRQELGDSRGAAQHLRVYLKQYPDDIDGIRWLEELEHPGSLDDPQQVLDSVRASVPS